MKGCSMADSKCSLKELPRELDGCCGGGGCENGQEKRRGSLPSIVSSNQRCTNVPPISLCWVSRCWGIVFSPSGKLPRRALAN
jgi:hypothetical protein